MKYYGYLFLVLASLVASVIVQGKNLFSSEFFIVAYMAMAAVLVVGSKYQESYIIDVILGLLLIFSVGFLSTEFLIKMLAGRPVDGAVFRMAVIAALDYCAIGFLRLSRKMKNKVILRDGYKYVISGKQEAD